eukprot:m.96515 g.96515  ORF g.96515 m.96515 type:complete len:607 (-) comp14796_c0_seq2:199-2019(-)
MASIKVENLDEASASEETLKNLFADYGIESVEVYPSGTNSYAVVTFKSEENAQNAVTAFDKRLLGKKRLRITKGLLPSPSPSQPATTPKPALVASPPVLQQADRPDGSVSPARTYPGVAPARSPLATPTSPMTASPMNSMTTSTMSTVSSAATMTTSRFVGASNFRGPAMSHGPPPLPMQHVSYASTDTYQYTSRQTHTAASRTDRIEVHFRQPPPTAAPTPSVPAPPITVQTHPVRGGQQPQAKWWQMIPKPQPSNNEGPAPAILIDAPSQQHRVRLVRVSKPPVWLPAECKEDIQAREFGCFRIESLGPSEPCSPDPNSTKIVPDQIRRAASEATLYGATCCGKVVFGESYFIVHNSRQILEESQEDFRAMLQENVIRHVFRERLPAKSELTSALCSVGKTEYLGDAILIETTSEDNAVGLFYVDNAGQVHPEKAAFKIGGCQAKNVRFLSEAELVATASKIKALPSTGIVPAGLKTQLTRRFDLIECPHEWLGRFTTGKLFAKHSQESFVEMSLFKRRLDRKEEKEGQVSAVDISPMSEPDYPTFRTTVIRVTRGVDFQFILSEIPPIGETGPNSNVDKVIESSMEGITLARSISNEYSKLGH